MRAPLGCGYCAGGGGFYATAGSCLANSPVLFCVVLSAELITNLLVEVEKISNKLRTVLRHFF